MRKIEDYYTLIFSFPRVNTLITCIALINVIRCCFVISTNLSDVIRVVVISIYYDILITVIAFLASFLLNFKRALGLTCVNDILTTILFFFMSILGTLTNHWTIMSYILSSYAISYCLLHLVLRAFTDNVKIILVLILFYSTPIIVLSSQTIILLIPVIELFVSLVIAETAILLIGKSGKFLIGINGTKIFKAFMKLLLLNDNKDLERILKNNLSKRERVKVTIITFKRINDGKVKATLVIPRVHPGPFRNVGSSNLPSMLVNHLEKYNINAIVLHRASTHNLDMVSSEETNALVNEIGNIVTLTNRLDIVNVSRPLLKERADYRCLGQRFGKYLLVIVSRKDQGMEDVPEFFEMDVNSRFNKEGYEIIVVDAHNSIDYEGRNVTLTRGSKDYNELVKLVLDVAEELCRNEGQRVVKAGVYRLKSKFDPLLGLGDCGVASLILVVKESELSLLIFDANNIILGLRDCLVDRLRDEQLLVTEILTTDNHTIAGVLPRVKYNPLGLKVSVDKLFDMSKSVLIGSLNNLEPVKVLVGTVEKEVSVLGGENFEKIRTFILANIKIVKIALSSILLMTLTHALTILLT